MMGYHMNFLMGIFANLRFANTNSGFGWANLILAILTLLFLCGLLVVSILKQRRIEQIIGELKHHSHTREEMKLRKSVRQNKYLKKDPDTRYWLFQKRGASTKLTGLSCYFYQ